MKTTKIITVIVCLIVLLTITGVGVFSGNYSLLFAPGLAVVVAAFKSKHLYDDPEVVSELKIQHSDAIRTLTQASAEKEVEFNRSEARLKTHYEDLLSEERAKVVKFESAAERAAKDLEEYKDRVPQRLIDEEIGNSLIRSTNK